MHLASARPTRSEAVEGVTLLSSMLLLPSIKAMEDFAASNAIQKQLLYVTLAAVTKCWLVTGWSRWASLGNHQGWVCMSSPLLVLPFYYVLGFPFYWCRVACACSFLERLLAAGFCMVLFFGGLKRRWFAFRAWVLLSFRLSHVLIPGLDTASWLLGGC